MNWISTIEPAPYRIAGFNLGPLRFGHCLLMERFSSDEGTRPIDLWRFLNICSRSHENAREWITKDINSVFSIRRWAFLKSASRRQRFLEVSEVFGAYIHENTALPEVMVPDTAESDKGTPQLQGLFNFATTALGYDPMRVMEAQYGQILWAAISHNETHGDIRIIDDRLQSIFERLQCQDLN